MKSMSLWGMDTGRRSTGTGWAQPCPLPSSTSLQRRRGLSGPGGVTTGSGSPDTSSHMKPRVGCLRLKSAQAKV